jgi:hypothetical protein
MGDILEKAGGDILGIIEQSRHRATQADRNTSCLAGLHHLVTGARQEPGEQ